MDHRRPRRGQGQAGHGRGAHRRSDPVQPGGPPTTGRRWSPGVGAPASVGDAPASGRRHGRLAGAHRGIATDHRERLGGAAAVGRRAGRRGDPAALGRGGPDGPGDGAGPAAWSRPGMRRSRGRERRSSRRSSTRSRTTCGRRWPPSGPRPGHLLDPGHGPEHRGPHRQRDRHRPGGREPRTAGGQPPGPEPHRGRRPRDRPGDLRAGRSARAVARPAPASPRGPRGERERAGRPAAGAGRCGAVRPGPDQPAGERRQVRSRRRAHRRERGTGRVPWSG